jgi:hypothetical protein
MTPCPPRELLQRFLADQLSEAEGAAAGAHVDTCPDCHQILETLTDLSEKDEGGRRKDEGRQPDASDSSFLLPPSSFSREGEPLRDVELRRLRQLFAGEKPAGSGTELSGTAHPPTSWPVLPGYEILGELGRGGMGIVYKARCLRLNRLVALKVVRADSAAALTQHSRFLVEGEVLARLQHPNVVQIYDIGFYQGQRYCALELVAGGSLAARLDGQPLPVREAAQLVASLAQAVYAAHAQHIIHRDLKPANVLLTTDGVPKVTDFGLAKMVDVDLKLTQTGGVFGTPAYMAPEQALGQTAHIGPHTDIHALGVILYEALTGRPPFLGATCQEVLQQVSWHEPVPPRQLQPQVPRDLETICLRCLQKEPRNRYASARELADDLQRFLNGEPIRARPVGGAERLGRWCRRNPAVVSLAFVALALLFGLAGVSWKWLQAEGKLSEVNRQRAASAAWRPLALRAQAQERQTDGKILRHNSGG